MAVSGSPGGAGGGMPGGGVSFSFGGGSGDGGSDGGGGMSPEQAQFLFSQFFGGSINGGSSSTSDPFGGMMGGDMNEGTHQRSRREGGRSMPFGDLSNGMHNMHMGGGPDSFGMNKRRRTSPSSSHYQKQKQYQTIPISTVVTLQGLRRKPERNGDRGQIVQYDSNTGRYIIQIEHTNETMKVKPTNLFQHDVPVSSNQNGCTSNNNNNYYQPNNNSRYQQNQNQYRRQQLHQKQQRLNNNYQQMNTMQNQMNQMNMKK